MIKVKNIEVWGFEHAIRGMRNPLNSWDRSDSGHCGGFYCKTQCRYKNDNCFDIANGDFVIGKNDVDLMKRLYKAGTEHRKYARQIFVSMDITAPLYLLKELDTYKVGTASNSCSTMYNIHKREFTLDDFSHEHLFNVSDLEDIITKLNVYREKYLETKNKDYWWQMIQLLPSSYNQRRTITMNYENVFNIIHQRTGHKLDEWNKFVEFLKALPCIKEIMGE